ncbi:MAG: leader peptide processing enzyme [Spirochaetia bacterium]|nr:leader peptide processing enzyme [Spirochaetia bacterium]MCF7940864.1 leader peptide processing enzyme [Spirochaetia bacterium]
MNKKVNTALFIIGATVFNIVLMLVCFLLAIAALGAVLSAETSATTAQIFLLLAFLVSIGVTYGLYSLLIKYISGKVDMERYFHPIFHQRKRK